MKFESSAEPIANFFNVKTILNLWAPGAFWLDEPWALSFKLKSSFEVAKVSATSKPILYDGEFVYLSNITVCLETSTWNPFI